MNCREAQTLIHKELDRELSEGERQELERHFEACSACSAERDGLARLLGAARDMRLRDGPPPDLARRVAARIQRRRRFRLALGAGLAAAAVLLLCLTLWPRTEPTGAPRGPAVRRPLTQRTLLPARQAPERVAALSPDNVLAWLEDAWQRTTTQVRTDLSSVQISLLPEDFNWREELQNELRETGSIVLQVTREVGAQWLPLQVPRMEPSRQNG